MRRPLLEEDGVLLDLPVAELGGWDAVARRGGAALLRWRHEALQAERAGVAVVEALSSGSFAQAVVHVQRSKDATLWDVARAWEALEPGGRLVVVGENRLGVKSLIKNLSSVLSQEGEVLVSRERKRVARFYRTHDVTMSAPEAADILLPEPFAGPPLQTMPGVFSAGELDAGTARLLAELPQAVEQPPKKVLDLACGVGPLAVAALRLWPEATAVLLDADRVAVDCSAENLRRSGLHHRAESHWWDVSEPAPEASFDLVLVNPPFHGPRDADLDLGRRILSVGASCVGPGGIMLVVANRHLPYEAALAQWGTVAPCGGEGSGFKVLALRRSS